MGQSVVLTMLREHQMLAQGHYALEGRFAGREWCVADFLIKERVLNEINFLNWGAGAVAAAVPKAYWKKFERVLIAGVPHGGSYLAPLVAFHLSELMSSPGQRVAVVLFDEDETGQMTYVPRDQQLLNDYTVMACVDVLMSGRKVGRLAHRLLHDFDKSLAGILAFAVRKMPRQLDLGRVPIFTPLILQSAYARGECPQCQRGVMRQHPPEHYVAKGL